MYYNSHLLFFVDLPLPREVYECFLEATTMAHPCDHDEGLNIQDEDLEICAIRTMAFGLWDLWSEFLSSPQYSSYRTRSIW